MILVDRLLSGAVTRTLQTHLQPERYMTAFNLDAKLASHPILIKQRAPNPSNFN
jgi:hypothetical protein